MLLGWPADFPGGNQCAWAVEDMIVQGKKRTCSSDRGNPVMVTPRLPFSVAEIDFVMCCV